MKFENKWIPNPYAHVAPARERGLKSCGQCLGCRLDKVAPARERGLKSSPNRADALALTVAPARERGLKSATQHKYTPDFGRSRKGAWIEIAVRAEFGNDPRVAPARERGLK